MMHGVGKCGLHRPERYGRNVVRTVAQLEKVPQVASVGAQPQVDSFSSSPLYPITLESPEDRTSNRSLLKLSPLPSFVRRRILGWSHL